MGNSEPRISVIVPMFNAVETVERTLNSILDQDEPVVAYFVDDRSEDDTADFVDELKEIYRCDIRVLRSDRNLGVSGARNLGIDEVRTPYVAFLDADDIWLPGKLKKQLRVIEANDRVSLVTCDSLRVSPSGGIISRGHKNHAPVAGPNAWKELLAHNFIPTPTVLTRTDIIRSVGGFKPELVVGEDLELWISIAKRGEIAVVEEVLVHYFDYSDSLMKRTEMNDERMILEMLQSQMDDERLGSEERKALLARRYFEMGRGFARHNSEHMQRYMDLAIENGFDRRKIERYLRKRSLKLSMRAVWRSCFK